MYGTCGKASPWKMNTLDLYVVSNYGPVLGRLGFTHVGYYCNDKSFGKETDRYRNESIGLDFLRDRDEDFVRVFPISHQQDYFDLSYLLEMIVPRHSVPCVRESLDALPRIISQITAMFASEHYACFRRAYMSFENCRNLAGPTG